MTSTKASLNDLISNPAAHFNSPMDVLQVKSLSVAEKKAILESWQVDEQEISTATAENMGKSDNNRLPEVLKALQQLQNQ